MILEEIGPWVVQWCCMGEQKGIFHIDTLDSAIRGYVGAFVGSSSPRYVAPWIILGLVKTSEEAQKLCDLLKSFQDKHGVGADDDRIFIPATEFPEQVAKLKAMPYKEYLRSGHWQEMREYAKRNAGNRCQICNAGGLIDVHHRTYENRGEERKSDVVVLCRDCHQTFHNAGKLLRR